MLGSIMPDMLAMLAILPPDASDIPDGSPPNMSAVDPSFFYFIRV